MVESWPEYLHHLTLHFPIAFSLGLGALAVWHVRDDAEPLRLIFRWAGWFTFTATTIAVVSGLVAAPEAFGEDVPEILSHHRNLGITVWCAMAVATIGYEIGTRSGERRVRRFAALCWIAVALGAIGAGHWGGSALHSDKIPWQGEPPVLAGDR